MPLYHYRLFRYEFSFIQDEISDIFNAFTIDVEVETADLNLQPGNGNEQLIDLGNFPIAFITGASQLQVYTLWYQQEPSLAAYLNLSTCTVCI